MEVISLKDKEGAPASAAKAFSPANKFLFSMLRVWDQQQRLRSPTLSVIVFLVEALQIIQFPIHLAVPCRIHPHIG